MQAGLLGSVGMTVGLVVECLLLIIRSNQPEPVEKRHAYLFGSGAHQAGQVVDNQQKQQKGKHGGASRCNGTSMAVDPATNKAKTS